MPILGIGQLTAIELAATDYISVAAESRLDTVSLFLNPMANIHGSCMTTAENSQQVKERLRVTGMKVANIEVFPMLPDLDVASYRPALELGCEIGARGVTVLLYDAQESRLIDNLSRMCEMASEAGLKVGIEFMPLAPGWATIQDAATLIARINKPNLGLVVDILHLIRSGGSPADVAATDPKLIFSAQLCDSANTEKTLDYIEEATANRLAPGQGRLPIQRFLQALPAGTPLELEVPTAGSAPARERVQAITAAARRQIELAGL